ncbi:hypothetical protein [Planococcus shenhongbingii]|uniref:Uncharacterized protein n=1 Tax=Planococcus shenhongbingii TaxID=3058398 RepID=A0ABT8NAA4_9BACL|nr:hypothetical protein [Planococcus sp. N017]MDN7244597.1 hypothetical protein [Planococcus sp. N017]
MWGIIGAGVMAVLTIVFSLAKASSKGEQLAKQHREEILARKGGKQRLMQEKSAEQKSVAQKNPPSSS